MTAGLSQTHDEAPTLDGVEAVLDDKVPGLLQRGLVLCQRHLQRLR
jgi:hypothetical protein